MSEKLDTITSFAKKATDALMIFNPRGTGLGVVFGGFLKVLVKTFDPILISHQLGSLDELNSVYLIMSGVFLFNIQTISPKNRIDPIYEKTLAEIEMAHKKGLLTQAAARMQYLAVMTKHINECVLKESVQASKDPESN